MIKKTQSNFTWSQNEWTMGQVITNEDAFAILFNEMTRSHLVTLISNWKAEAVAVSDDPTIAGAQLWTAQDTTDLQTQVAKLVEITCRMCLLKGHEASYCPFNAQMNRLCASDPASHALWKRWRIARAQHVKNRAAAEAMAAASRASKSRADSMSAITSAAASTFLM